MLSPNARARKERIFSTAVRPKIGKKGALDKYLPGGTRQGGQPNQDKPGGTHQGAACTTRINLEEPVRVATRTLHL